MSSSLGHRSYRSRCEVSNMCHVHAHRRPLVQGYRKLLAGNGLQPGYVLARREERGGEGRCAGGVRRARV